MSEYVEVRTQADLEKALKRSGVIPVCVGKGSFVVAGSAVVTAYGSAVVTAYGSAVVTAHGSAVVKAYGSAVVKASGSAVVKAYDSAVVTAYGSAVVTAYGSAVVAAYGSAVVTAHGSAVVTASGSAVVTAHGSAVVTAYGSAVVKASGSAVVKASKYVAVQKMAHGTQRISGGVVIEVPVLTTAREWCDYYGVTVKRGVALLFKAVDDEYRSHHNGFAYTPGTKPEAPDWDDGKKECGGGLHFSPRPWMAREFFENATRYVCCPVTLTEIVVHPDAQYPQKVKAPRVCGPVWECDEDGEPMAGEKSA